MAEIDRDGLYGDFSNGMHVYSAGFVKAFSFVHEVNCLRFINISVGKVSVFFCNR